jgi:hypothetical protein
MTPSGIDPATIRFVMQCLNHCATACPLHTHEGKIVTASRECEGKERAGYGVDSSSQIILK